MGYVGKELSIIYWYIFCQEKGGMILENIGTKKRASLESFQNYYHAYLKGGLKGFYITNTKQAKARDGRDYSLSIKHEGLTLVLGKKNVVWTYDFETGDTFCNGVLSRFSTFHALLRKVHTDQKNQKIDCFIEK